VALRGKRRRSGQSGLMKIEAVLLTGGTSTRMGQDKAQIEIEGVPIAIRIGRALQDAGYPVTVLGSNSIEEFSFQPDLEEYQGPLSALSKFWPNAELVFVASCDMPLFDASVVKLLESKIGDADACVPNLEGRLQPTCALYRTTSLQTARETIGEGKKSLFAWLEKLKVREVTEDELRAAGIKRRACLGANTPEELQALLTGS